MKEAEILDLAINNFELITGADFKITGLEDRKTNADVQLQLNFKDKLEEFYAEVKNEYAAFRYQRLLNTSNSLNQIGYCWRSIFPQPLKLN